MLMVRPQRWMRCMLCVMLHSCPLCVATAPKGWEQSLRIRACGNQSTKHGWRRSVATSYSLSTQSFARPTHASTWKNYVAESENGNKPCAWPSDYRGHRPEDLSMPHAVASTTPNVPLSYPVGPTNEPAQKSHQTFCHQHCRH